MRIILLAGGVLRADFIIDSSAWQHTEMGPGTHIAPFTLRYKTMLSEATGSTSCFDDDLPLWTFEKNELGGSRINHVVLPSSKLIVEVRVMEEAMKNCYLLWCAGRVSVSQHQEKGSVNSAV